MKHILWVDLEMTGLDPETCVIIEIAAIITDLEFTPLAEYEAIVYQPPEQLAGMDDWNVNTHTQSGLLAKIPSGKPLSQVEQELGELLDSIFAGEPAVLAGNSIHQDRKFIDRYMKTFASKLSYRMLDVSAFKLVFKNLYDVNFAKENNHRALEDIQASINELRHYLTFVTSKA